MSLYESMVSKDEIAINSVRVKLREVSDAGVDTGRGQMTRDFWLSINGTEYLVTMARSARQHSIDALSLSQESD